MEQKPTIWQAGLRIGLILALIFIIYSLILQLTGLVANQYLSYVNYLITIGGIIWAHKSYKEMGDGYMSYGQGLGLGVYVAGLAGIISSIFLYLYLTLIDNSMIAIIMEKTRRDMEASGRGDDEIEQALSMTEKMMTPEMIVIFAILGSLLMGLVFSLIISAFTKNSNPEAEYR